MKIVKISLKILIISSFILSLCVSSVHCQNDYEEGKIVVIFNKEVSEETAVKFIKHFNLEITGKYYFEPPSIQFNVESDVDSFIREIKRDLIVSSVTKGRQVEVNGREGTVVRVIFKRGTDAEKIDEFNQKYGKHKGLIAWRYFISKFPVMIIKVSVGREQEIVNNINKTEYKELVNKASLISQDFAN